MLDQHDATKLPGWLEKLTTCGHPTLTGLAKGIREDQDAVVQGITTAYNSGMNEGRVTDVKLQKRIMSGRAGVPLLTTTRRSDRLPETPLHRPDPVPVMISSYENLARAAEVQSCVRMNVQRC